MREARDTPLTAAKAAKAPTKGLAVTLAPAVQPSSFRSRLRQPTARPSRTKQVSEEVEFDNTARVQIQLCDLKLPLNNSTPEVQWRAAQVVLDSSPAPQELQQPTDPGCGSTVSPLVIELKPSRIPRYDSFCCQTPDRICCGTGAGLSAP